MPASTRAGLRIQAFVSFVENVQVLAPPGTAMSIDGNDIDFSEATLQSPTSDLIFRSGFDS